MLREKARNNSKIAGLTRRSLALIFLLFSLGGCGHPDEHISIADTAGSVIIKGRIGFAGNCYLKSYEPLKSTVKEIGTAKNIGRPVLSNECIWYTSQRELHSAITVIQYNPQSGLTKKLFQWPYIGLIKKEGGYFYVEGVLGHSCPN